MPIESTEIGGLIVLIDADGNRVSGLAESQSILEAMSKASFQPPGTYYAEHPRVRFDVTADRVGLPVEPDPGDGGDNTQSNLSAFSEGLAPGQFSEFPAPSLAQRDSSGTYTWDKADETTTNSKSPLDWGSFMPYDSVLRRFSVASGRDKDVPAFQKYITYDVDTDTWDSEVSWSGQGGGHLYNSNAIDPVSRTFFYAPFNSNHIITKHLDTGVVGQISQPSGNEFPGRNGGTSVGAGARTIVWHPGMGTEGTLLFIERAYGPRIAGFDWATQTWGNVGFVDTLIYPDSIPMQHMAGHYVPANDTVVFGFSQAEDNRPLVRVTAAGVISLTAPAPCHINCSGSQASPFVPHPTRAASFAFCSGSNKIWSYEHDSDTWVDRGALPSEIDTSRTVGMPYENVVMFPVFGFGDNSKTYVYKLSDSDPVDPVDPVEPEPEPEPEPTPDPVEPTPTPDTDQPTAKITSLDLNPQTNVISLSGWYYHARYMRDQKYMELVGDVDKVYFGCTNHANGGGTVKLAGDYAVVLKPMGADADNALDDTVSVAQAHVSTEGADVMSAELDISGLPHGWYWARVVSPNQFDISVPYPYFINRGEGPVQNMPIITMSAESVRTGRHHVKMSVVPARYNPTPVPIVPRVATGSLVADPWYWHYHTSRMTIAASSYLPRVSDDGIVHSANHQRYRWQDYMAKTPVFQLFDGPRGVATAQCPTHIHVTRDGAAICTDPWRVYKVEKDGHLTTQAGYRTNPVTFELELVGDWSAVPEERRGFHELWGHAYDERTLVTDPNLPQIGDEDTHPTDVRKFVFDSQNNRVCLLTQSRESRFSDSVVTEFLTDLSDPWDGLCIDGVLYVAERTANKISMWDATTAEPLGNFVESPQGYARVSHSRFVSRLVPQSSIDGQDCIAPEGMYRIPGDDEWIYFGSDVMRAVKRKSRITGVVEVMWSNLISDHNTNFYKFAISDHGVLHLSTWTIKFGGTPLIYLPGSNTAKYRAIMDPNKQRTLAGVPDDEYNTSPIVSGMYGTAVGLGHGENGGYMYYGNGGGVMVQVTPRVDGDPEVDDLSKYNRGSSEWRAKGYDIIYGKAAQNPYGLGMPEFSEDVNYYLSFMEI